jgi:hypothetical protein
MLSRPIPIVVAVATIFVVVAVSGGRAQDAKKSKDDGSAQKGASKSAGSRAVAPKDQEVDDLLQKLGETKDEPSPDDRPKNPAAGGREPPEPSRPDKPARPKLPEKDKPIDERLEEYTGRKKKKPAGDEERKGPIGEIIKEMRDVEKRLGKPDPSEETQNKQKQIVKRIETLIEEARQSGSSAGRLIMRRVRQPGQPGGQQEGDQPGAQAQGAPATKPAKPTSSHSTASGKAIWGHLPPELREVMDNTMQEMALSSKAELVSRYFLSINKGKLVREE